MRYGYIGCEKRLVTLRTVMANLSKKVKFCTLFFFLLYWLVDHFSYFLKIFLIVYSLFYDIKSRYIKIKAWIIGSPSLV